MSFHFCWRAIIYLPSAVERRNELVLNQQSNVLSKSVCLHINVGWFPQISWWRAVVHNRPVCSIKTWFRVTHSFCFQGRIHFKIHTLQSATVEPLPVSSTPQLHLVRGKVNAVKRWSSSEAGSLLCFLSSLPFPFTLSSCMPAFLFHQRMSFLYLVRKRKAGVLFNLKNNLQNTIVWFLCCRWLEWRTFSSRKTVFWPQRLKSKCFLSVWGLLSGCTQRYEAVSKETLIGCVH